MASRVFVTRFLDSETRRIFRCLRKERLLNSWLSTSNYNGTYGTSETQPNILKSKALEKTTAVAREQKISRAMKAYLQRAQEYGEFMKKETAEYEIGRRHLANMMGVEADSFTQEDIDKAVEYLMPSGLFQIRARPVFKPPEQIFPNKKAAEFDVEGRPFHCFFYTGKPNYYQVLHEIAANLELVNKYEDDMIRKGIRDPDPECLHYLKGSEWISKKDLEKKIVESVRDEEYTYFVNSFSRLSNHPYSKKCQEFVMNYRRPLIEQLVAMEIPPLKYDDNGRPYMDAIGKRKWARSKVTVRGNGTGQVNINGQDITYFKSVQCREQVMFPLQFTNLLGDVDLEATVEASGTSAQAGAIRQATSLALRSFLTKEEVERMRLAGLLTWDPRIRERKKYGQKGARAKFTWKKR